MFHVCFIRFETFYRLIIFQTGLLKYQAQFAAISVLLITDFRSALQKEIKLQLQKIIFHILNLF